MPATGQCTVAEAAAILGRSAGSVMRFGERGHLTRIQIAKRGTITFHRSEVVELARRLGVEV
jgi:hypothetical protein